jgi:GPI mannosyltransferase 3
MFNNEAKTDWLAESVSQHTHTQPYLHVIVTVFNRRFIFPLLPLAIQFCAIGLEWLWHVGDSSHHHHHHHPPAHHPKRLSNATRAPPTRRPLNYHRRRRIVRLLVVVLMAANIPMALYFSVYHQRGTIDVMAYIRDYQHSDMSAVHFLTPCHATPFYAHVHRKLPMHFLDCSPAFVRQSTSSATATATATTASENEQFFAAPIEYLNTRYQQPGTVATTTNTLALPSHFVMFQPLVPQILPFLQRHAYRECTRFFHTYTPLDAKQGDVVVYCKASS